MEISQHSATFDFLIFKNLKGGGVDVDDIIDESWTPQMHLTQEERNVVEAKGTILLLGRSVILIIS